MALYMMLGKYSDKSMEKIDANRTRAAVGVIERVNGQVVAMYAMLGEYDVVLIVNLPGNREAMEVSVGLSRVTDLRFVTGPVIPIERFDDMIKTRRNGDEGESDLPDDLDLPGDRGGN